MGKSSPSALWAARLSSWQSGRLILCVASLSACTYAPNAAQQTRIDRILAESRETLRDERFRSALRSLPQQAFDHASDPVSHRAHSGADVLRGLELHLPTRAVCRRAKNPWNKGTNAWDGGGVPQLRCAFLDKRSDALWVGTVLHEAAHAAGYLHDGQRRTGNECTVPHIIGDLAALSAGRADDPAATLPDDACNKLTTAIQQLPASGPSASTPRSRNGQGASCSLCSAEPAWSTRTHVGEARHWRSPKQRTHLAQETSACSP